MEQGHKLVTGTTSYMCEAFRSGLESVTKGQRESKLSIRLTESQLITNVILPQAFTVSFPAIAANIIFLLKETSVIGILALMHKQATTESSMVGFDIFYHLEPE